MSEIKKILIDIGSSTVKVYSLTGEFLNLLLVKSISFKEGFDPTIGLTESKKRELCKLIGEIKNKYPKSQIKIFATSLFRKLDVKARVTFVDEFFLKTGLYFNIISQDLESFYLQIALVGKYKHSKKPILLINIGGGSTELVVMCGKVVIETKNMDLGVGTILAEFPKINNDNIVSLDTVKKFALSKLPLLESKAKVAFYSGGELNYMQLVKFPLMVNSLFEDTDHPSLISLKNFSEKNKEVFTKTTIPDLEKLMPDNPTWMHGARACSVLAQAICEKYGVHIIIPSNSNLINGAARQEFRCVTLSGSFRKHLDFILKVREDLTEKGINVLSPRFVEPKNPGEEFVVFGGEEGLSPLELERHHLDSIENSDALIVCDPEGYVGASALIEIGYAQKLGKRIIFIEKPEEFMLQTLPSEVGL